MQPLHRGCERPVQRLNTCQSLGKHFDEDSAPILGVVRAPYEAIPLEPVDHRCRGTSREAGVSRELAGRRRACEKKQVQAFEIRGVKAHLVRHGVAEQDGLRADAPQQAIERTQQFLTGTRHIHLDNQVS